MDYYGIASSMELAHHGVKGQKWGVRRTPAQLGHAVQRGTRFIASYIKRAGHSIGEARRTHTAKTTARREKKLAKRTAKLESLERQNALHNREVAAKQAAYASRHPHLVKRQARLAVKQAKREADARAKEQAVRNVKYGLMTSAMMAAGNAAGKMLMSSIVNSNSASDGVKTFAKYMGGEEKKTKNSLSYVKDRSLDQLDDSELASLSKRMENMAKTERIMKQRRSSSR